MRSFSEVRDLFAALVRAGAAHIPGRSTIQMRSLLTKAVIVAALISAPMMKAQNSSALTGEVTDASGAAVPNALVVLTNPSTGVKYTQQTDSKGSYRFQAVPPQQGYVVTVTHEGFNAAIVKDMTLQVAITRTQDVSLAAGSSQKVDVSASSQEVTLNTTDATIGNNFDVQQLNELPVQNRASIGVLFQLQPGVNYQGSVTGARTDQTQVTLDGMDVNDISTGSNVSFTGSGSQVGAPVDAIQEFRGTVAGQPPANVSGGGGVFQLVTKSGTNQFHGNLNEYHRDPSTQANTWFNNNQAAGIVVPKAKLVENQFGGNIGGPIRIPKLFNGRDRAFFFFNFNNGRRAQTAQATRTVPLDSFRSGQIGYTNNTAGCGTASRATTAPQCISYLTPAQVAAIDPLATTNPAAAGEDQSLFAYVNARYPHANNLSTGDGVNTGGYFFTQKYLRNEYNYVGRVDFNLTPKQRIFIRGIQDRVDGLQALNQFDVDPLSYPNQTRSYGYVASHIWQIGSNKVNQFYYGDTVTILSFPVNYRPTGVSSFTFGPLTAPNGSLSSQGRRVPIPEIRDDYNWQVKSHTIQLGGTFKFIKTHSNLTNDYNFVGIGIGGNTAALSAALRPGNINASTTIASRYDSALAFSLGRVASQSRNYNYDAAGNALAAGTGSNRAYRSYQTELYLADTWKASPSLTLTYGLRWQLYTTPYEVLGRQTNQNFGFDDYFAARLTQSAGSASGNAAVPFITYSLGGKANNAAPAFNQSYKDFSPRFGFSFNPQAHPSTVLNGSFGLVFDRTVYNALNFVQDQLSYFFANNQAVNYGNADPSVALATDPRVTVTSAGNTFTSSSNPGTATFAIPAAPAPVAISRSAPYTPYVTGGVPVGITAGQTNYAIDKNFKSPYNLNFNLGMQQKIPGGFIASASYVGHLGRRLIGQADASQLLDYRDPASGQYLSQAFAQLSNQLRHGVTAANVTPQPWFEDQIASRGTAPNKTARLATNAGSTVAIGDFADTVQYLQATGYIAKNIGLAGQFGADTFITNKGWSSYHGGLFTLTKNPSHGLQFQLNYTLAHSTDNVSAVANSIGISSGLGQICDATNTGACYGNSDFDVKHTITSNFVYDLPFGRGRTFANHVNRFVDAAIGGWSVSGIPAWRSGLAWGTTTGAYLAGYANNVPAVFSGNTSLIHKNLHKKANGAAAGQLVLFDDAVANNATDVNSGATGAFRNPLGFEYGSRNNLRGPTAFTFDAGLGKRFQIVENKVSFQIRGDAFNVLNHPVFSTPSVTNINSAPFGQITAQSGVTANSGARLIQVSGRIEF